MLSRDPERFFSAFPEFVRLPQVQWVTGDVRDFHFPEACEAILHGAAPVDPTLERERPEELRSIILDGTKRVLEFARQSESARMLLVSSGAVYGPQDPECERMPEDYPCRPVTVYGKSKLEAEQLCLDSGIHVAIARCFAFTGLYLPLDGHLAVGNFLRDALLRRPIEVQGDGRPVRSYLDANDLARWLWILLDHGAAGRVYNVGSEETVSIAELAHICALLCSPALPVRILGRPDAGPAPRYVPDISRIRRELAAIPAVNLGLSLRRVFEFHRKRGILIGKP